MWHLITRRFGKRRIHRSFHYFQDGAGQGLWVAVGYGSGIAKSSDGNTWTAIPAASRGGIINYAYGVAYGKDGAGQGLWIVVGEDSIIAKSSDGNTWTTTGSKGGITSGRGIAFKNEDV